MKKPMSSFLSLSTVGLLLGVGVSLNAQQDASRPGNDPQSQQQQARPDNAPGATATSSQTFTGTIMKSGDKYVLQAAHGNIYGLDNQEAVSQFEGKQVTIHGILDPKTKMIRMDQ
jgi:hypothetical protein